MSLEWFQHIANPYKLGLKKYFFQLLGEDYSEFEDTAEKLAHSAASEKEYTAIGDLLVKIYEKGYFQAVEDHRGALERLGYKVNLSHPEPPKKAHKIFDQEKSG